MLCCSTSTSTGLCPKGNDPLTLYTDYRSLLITVAPASSNTFTGHVKFSFEEQSLSIPHSGWTDEQCAEAFEALPNLHNVECSVEYHSSDDPDPELRGGFTLLVELAEFPVLPYQNNVYAHDGNPPLSSFHCDTSEVVSSGSVVCTIKDVAVNALPGMVWNSMSATTPRLPSEKYIQYY